MNHQILSRLRSLYPTAILIVGVFALRSSLADQYVIPSGSMEPTIEIGDHVFVNKMEYDLKIPFTSISLTKVSEPKRGDVIVFKDPRNPKINLIKRLIGIPGDHLVIHAGVVEVNGQKLELAKAPQSDHSRLEMVELIDTRSHWVKRLPGQMTQEHLELTVPEGRYFFMGDNRDNSADSRFWGYADREALMGRARRILYSVRLDRGFPFLSLSRSGKGLEI